MVPCLAASVIKLNLTTSSFKSDSLRQSVSFDKWYNAYDTQNVFNSYWNVEKHKISTSPKKVSNVIQIGMNAYFVVCGASNRIKWNNIFRCSTIFYNVRAELFQWFFISELHEWSNLVYPCSLRETSGAHTHTLSSSNGADFSPKSLFQIQKKTLYSCICDFLWSNLTSANTTKWTKYKICIKKK
jgi:hypothetical protein